MNYGTFIMNAVNDMLTKDFVFPIREHVLYRDIEQRAIDAKCVENCMMYEIPLTGIAGLEPRTVVFLDISNVKTEDDTPFYPVGIEGFIRRNAATQIYQIILVDLTPVKNDASLNALAVFFETFRNVVNDIFNVDPYLDQRSRLILSHFFAFAMIHRTYMLDKEQWLQMQTVMKSKTNKGIHENNNLYEKLSNLVNNNNYNENDILKAFEEGIICVGTDNVDETGPVPEVSEEQHD